MRIRISTGRYGEDRPWQDLAVDSAVDFAHRVREIWTRLDSEGRLRHPSTGGRHLEIHIRDSCRWVTVPGRRGGSALVSSPLHAADLWPLVEEMAAHADAIKQLAQRAAEMVTGAD